ncbi:MAG: TolC family protein [Polaromonas sp.]|jgi:outer membrane protein TolC|nr:TolC family protein [Polaromonas sp.]MBP6088712.1 TolC family protein [Polaromonas sp.]MBP6155493.1 TolC family protein [Polaromonas sp.]MBP7115651.1 TolC family protein [Polaromonas sp.]MBP7308456.1 TolC family protein [Polaromonas sp.]
MKLKTPIYIAVIVLLSGCASVNIDGALERTSDETKSLSGASTQLLRTLDAKTARDNQVTALLKSPLSQQAAVQLAVINSPALQTLLAERWGDLAQAAQSGRIANPILSLERVRFLDELEFGRILAFGLLDLLTLPQRNKIATARMKQAELQLTTDVVGLVSQVRMAWVASVGAAESLSYARQVYASAQASAELARRMQSVGNFNRLQRARQQAFYADAAAQLLASQQTATSTRESLVRLLGLKDKQAQVLKLPERLPDLPKSYLMPDAVSKVLTTQRLDVRMAQSQLDASIETQGLAVITSLTDIELGLRSDTVKDTHEGTSDKRKGYELAIRLPIFDWGDAQRANMNAAALAALNRMETVLVNAGSELRENYAAYRSAYDLSRHYREEVLPLGKIIAEENLLGYNGMLIGVFELLADHRSQVNTVKAAIAAQQQFWQADAALQATLLGKPISAPAMSVGVSSAGGDAKAH